jgi:hypothetical protein
MMTRNARGIDEDRLTIHGSRIRYVLKEYRVILHEKGVLSAFWFRINNIKLWCLDCQILKMRSKVFRILIRVIKRAFLHFEKMEQQYEYYNRFGKFIIFISVLLPLGSFLIISTLLILLVIYSSNLFYFIPKEKKTVKNKLALAIMSGKM